MDSGETDKFEGEKRNEDPASFHSDWRFGGANLANTSMGLIHMGNPIALRKGDLIGSSTSCASSSIVDSYCPVPWDHHSNPQSLSPLTFRKGVPGSMGAPTDNFGWNPPPSPTMKGGVFLPNVSGILPQSLSQFPADSAFIERAARFSCFNGGNFSDMVNQLSCREPMNPYSSGSGIVQGSQEVFTNDPLKIVPRKNVSLSVEHGATEGSPLKNERKSEGFARTHDEAKEGAGVSCNESDEAGFSGSGGQEETFMLDEKVGEPSAKGIGLKKRKRSGQDVELNQVKGALPQINDAAKGNTEIQQKGGENPTSISNKSVGKQSKHGTQASEPSKEEYIHVRARRGQATNSHSLAERVRREKISERMKYLQDLVPGCSKVTGKAVMLDEIINYVQSLQRQVEFLSMKLATVNPRLDLNIEGLLAKDILQSRAGPSSALGFSSDMAVTYAQPHPSQPGLMLSGFSNMENPSDALRRTMTSKLTAMNGGFREPTQLSNVWEDELHNVVQMSFDTTALSNSQDINASPPPPGHAKVEL